MVSSKRWGMSSMSLYRFAFTWFPHVCHKWSERMTHARSRSTWSLKMQATVPTASIARNIGPPVRGIASSSPNEDSSRSQGMATSLPLTKLQTADERTSTERKESEDCKMKTEVSCLKYNVSRFFKRFLKKKTTSSRHWKPCEVVFLALATVVTASIHAVPTILYCTVEVSVRIIYILY